MSSLSPRCPGSSHLQLRVGRRGRSPGAPVWLQSNFQMFPFAMGGGDLAYISGVTGEPTKRACGALTGARGVRPERTAAGDTAADGTLSPGR